MYIVRMYDIYFYFIFLFNILSYYKIIKVYYCIFSSKFITLIKWFRRDPCVSNLTNSYLPDFEYTYLTSEQVGITLCYTLGI